jgi:type I restriction-modification system DNA methylase subunit
MSDPNLSSFIWSVADLLRGDYKQSEYGKVILPFTVLRRLDCVLELTKAGVLTELVKRKKAGLNPEPFLLRKSGQLFYNTSPLDLKKLMGDQDHKKGTDARLGYGVLQGIPPVDIAQISATDAAKLASLHDSISKRTGHPAFNKQGLGMDPVDL